MRAKPHLRAITRTPAGGQTGLQILLNGILDLMQLALVYHQRSPWKAWPTEGEDPANGTAPDPGNGFNGDGEF